MKLEDLQASAAVRGILSDGLVTVVRAAQGTLLNNENNWLRRFGDVSARIDHIPLAGRSYHQPTDRSWLNAQCSLPTTAGCVW